MTSRMLPLPPEMVCLGLCHDCQSDTTSRAEQAEAPILDALLSPTPPNLASDVLSLVEFTLRRWHRQPQMLSSCVLAHSAVIGSRRRAVQDNQKGSCPTMCVVAFISEWAWMYAGSPNGVPNQHSDFLLGRKHICLWSTRTNQGHPTVRCAQCFTNRKA